MLSLQSTRSAQFCDGHSRREFLRLGGLGVGGLTLPGFLQLESAVASQGRSKSPKSVIILFLSGGPAQQDMWDLKPDAPEEVRGTFKPISTNVPGIQITEHMPRMARVMDHCAIIRSMHHKDNGHPTAAYTMMVGEKMKRVTNTELLSREDRPHPGASLGRVLGPKQPSMPSWVLLPEYMPNQPFGPPRPGQHAGFLGAAYDSYAVESDPNESDYNPGVLKPLAQVAGGRMSLRRMMLDGINRQSLQLERASELDPFYAKAFDLISSSAAQRAFDISQEPAKVRDRYGRHAFGQSTLVARRLIEAGVRLVHVNWVRHDYAKGGQGYDSHADHLNWAKTELLPPTDNAFASLVEDLQLRGLLKDTLVVMMGEFGRTPKFNKEGGRDHWADCFSVVLAGGGIQGGQVYGASDAIAAYPVSNPVTPADLLATMYTAINVDPETEIHDTLGRPYFLSTGTPVSALL